MLFAQPQTAGSSKPLRDIKLHYVLFICFTLISSVPVLFLASWVQQSALEKEVSAVKEKHLLVAQNLTGDLTRYVTDVESAFRLITTNIEKNNPVLGLPSLLSSLDFRYILVTDKDANILSQLKPKKIKNKPRYSPVILSSKILKLVLPYIKKSKQQPHNIFFSDLIRDNDGQTTFFLYKQISKNRFAIGSLSTQHIRNAQKAVIFGERGHAAIVDRTGRAIAHPIANWVATMKDMSFLPPVKEMMKGNTGVSQFYTPAMKADMVAGYTVVAKTGWGVMIPQPYEELVKRANDVQYISYTITAFGIAIAGLISWFIAGKLCLPINSIIQSTQQLQKGHGLKTVMVGFKYIPYELRNLVSSFNQMVIEIKEKGNYLQLTSQRLEEAQKIAHIGNWELDFDSDRLWCSDEFFNICNIDTKYFSGSYQELLELIHSEDRKLFENTIKKLRIEGGRFKIEHRIVSPHHDTRIVRHEGEVLNDKKNSHIIGVIHDITEIYQYQEKLLKQANYDELTKLPNRNLLLELLNQEIIISSREKQKIGLLSIDLDNFKIINDTHGLLVGDKLLQNATKRLKSCIRESDTLARPSGDEFIILLRNISSEKDCVLIANKILDSFSQAFNINGIEAFTGASIGIAIFPTDTNEPVTLLRNADIALYRSKSSGKNSYCFFKKEMDDEISHRVHLTNDLRKAINQNELSVYYQPIVDLKSGKIKSAEALVRWQHPKHGFISPVEFIPIAEDSGLIGPLGLNVLKDACENAASWSRIIEEPPYVSVNLSVKQLKLGLTASIINDILVTSTLPPSHLTFEITESMVMDNIDESIEWMKTVKNLGVSFSIDDFGTGYSSLSYLKRLPVDVLKIDRSFIKDVLKNKEDASLVEIIIAIGKNLNLKLVAEGAEEEEQVNYLANLQCDSIQGYYFSKPLPAEEFVELIKNWIPRKFS